MRRWAPTTRAWTGFAGRSRSWRAPSRPRHEAVERPVQQLALLVRRPVAGIEDRFGGDPAHQDEQLAGGLLVAPEVLGEEVAEVEQAAALQLPELGVRDRGAPEREPGLPGA